MKFHTLLSSLQPLVSIPTENPEITGVEMDSRNVKPGYLFICIEGYTVDGHNYVKQAVENGAVAIVSQKTIETSVPVAYVKDTNRSMAVIGNSFYQNPTHKLNLVGITGTNGKTTTSYIIEEIVKRNNQKTGVIGTIGMKIGEEVFETKNTTPDSLTLQSMFAKMVEANVNTAVMEVSSHALHIGRVHGCEYDIAVFTNLSQDHLDYHGSMEEYKKAKGLLFSQLGNSFSSTKPKFAVLNGDDEASKEFMAFTQANILTYGLSEQFDLYAKNIELTNAGTRFTLHFLNESYIVEMKLIGTFNVYNVLAAIGAGIALNIKMETILDAIASIEGVPGRFQSVNAGQDFTVIVDYAHTPDSLENVLKTVKQFAKNDIYSVVGCGGDRDRTKRPLMGRIAADLSTQAIFTSDNPRTEDPNLILEDMKRGLEHNNITVIEDRKKAINFAIQNAKKHDIIVIAGKGHETYQIVGTNVFHFDDVEEAKEAILQRRG
ncbi:UDP-N-acetylmuramoyl-L-alanyl-D-glutamate--2,6-diaminopimelate ligase [Bacillus sp. EAC]|uniref:UDP-N-acetylmuramoyl-L-alanyl-D-glutamate--2, 6-diaminopimelate ligase n=1 Tax=Bacillus sp. EAC TaxID=1978338 RepID=UPI000B43A2FF|nr:UDP-N-acetylmuramoyl-L-alanyl-D-glutamate--2,6-diaminopimelate ligase [Bacillus sp. EAC]